MARVEAWGWSPRRWQPVAATVVAAAAFAFTAPAFGASETGGQPASFLTYGVGARALAMGGAYYAISDDATAGYWNPAGLALVQRKELTAMEATLYDQTKLNYFAYAHPLKGGSTFALSMTQLASTGFETVNATFDPSGDPSSITSAGTFADQEQAIGLSWGKAVTETVAFGATVQDISRKLAGSSDTSETLDMGVLKSMGPYKLGLGLQNAFSKTSGDTSDSLPVTIKIGNAVNLFKDRLTLGLDITKPLPAAIDVRFGGEYWISRWFAFRFGLMGLPSIQETDFGFGLNFHSFGLDIAQGIGDLGSSTRFSFTVRFGQSKSDRSNAQVKTAIKLGFEAFQEGNFTLAQQKFNQALDAEPGNKQVQAMVSRLSNVTTYIPQATGGEEFQTFVRKGVTAYVDGRDLRSAVNALRYAYNKNPKDDKLLGLLNVVEKEAGVSEITRRVEGPEQFTWVDQKVYDARQSVYDGHYDAAIRRAQDVLDLEPNNVTALEIMGSAFYLMEQKEKAIAVWKRVLELDPNNRAVREFLGNAAPAPQQ